MALQFKLCLAFLLVFHISLVSCRHDYFQYYSRYVKGESSTQSALSSTLSTTGASASESEPLSVSEVVLSEHVIPPKENSYSSSNDNFFERRSTVVQSSYTSYNDDMRTALLVRWGLIVGGFIVVGLIVCCVAVCCPCCCRGKERRGYIISNNIPQQPAPYLFQPPIQQAVTVQHCPPETQAPQNPPPYDTQPIQQQNQYSSTEHLLQQNPMHPVAQNFAEQQQFQTPQMFQDHHNPPVAPPPYPTKY